MQCLNAYECNAVALVTWGVTVPLMRHLAKLYFAVCFLFAVCNNYYTRQRACLPSAQYKALGKELGTWQRKVFPVVSGAAHAHRGNYTDGE